MRPKSKVIALFEIIFFLALFVVAMVVPVMVFLP